MNQAWSFYDSETGVFADRHAWLPERMVEANTPEGFTAIEGRFDPASQRVDVTTGEVVAYEPPVIDDEQTRERMAVRAKERIRALELSQLRPIRELMIDPLNLTARQRLREIEAEIGILRNDLITRP